MPDLTIQDYDIEQDSNGDLVAKDSNNNVVLRYDDASGDWKMDSVSVDAASVTNQFDAGSVSTGSTDSGEYLLDGNTIDDWVLIDEQEASSVDVDTDQYQEVKVVAFGSGTDEDVFLTIDNNTDAVYDYLSLSDTGITSNDDQSDATLFHVPNFGGARGEYTLSIRPQEGDRATISGLSSSYILTQDYLISGGVDDASSDLDSVQVETEGSAIQIEVWGRVQ